MKVVLSVLGQTILLLLTAVIFGIVLPGTRHSPFHVTRALPPQDGVSRQYEFDWLFGVLLVYLLILAIGLLAGRIRTSWKGSTIALLLTVAIVLLLTKIGYRDGNIAAMDAAIPCGHRLLREQV